MLREELQLLQEPGSYVGEVVKPMGKTKVLVKVSSNAYRGDGLQWQILASGVVGFGRKVHPGALLTSRPARSLLRY